MARGKTATVLKTFFLTITLLIGAYETLQAQEQDWYCSADNDVRYIDTALGKQKIMIIEPEGEAKELFFFLHGDSARRAPTYQYKMARKIVEFREGAMAVAILRPGYEDGCGDASEGDAGYKMGDNYTAEVVDALSEVISAVKSEYDFETTLFGHSGGAALTALLMNRYPDLADTARLAACPCDLKAWRQHMFERSGNERWISELPGLSPIEEINNIGMSSKILFFNTPDDDVTPLHITFKYVEALEARKLRVNGLITQTVPNSDGDKPYNGHDKIIEDETLKSFLNMK